MAVFRYYHRSLLMGGRDMKKISQAVLLCHWVYYVS